MISVPVAPPMNEIIAETANSSSGMPPSSWKKVGIQLVSSAMLPSDRKHAIHSSTVCRK